VGITGDGTQEWICVAPVSGGPCARISGSVDLVAWHDFASSQWAPDDSAIWSFPTEDGPALLLNPEGGDAQYPSWAAEGAHSWQRRAP
jgi:hypothetical protein